MILTIDFGTSVTKVGLWGGDGLVALGRSELTTTYPQVGWTEQDPLRWWTTVVIACAEVRAMAPSAFGEVDVVACSGARQTFVPVSAHGDPIGKGILWSDHRAAAEARVLADRMGGDDINRARTGIPLDAGAVAAKLAWLAKHQPERMEAADIILSPRDFIVYRMTDQMVTDATFASRSGLYDFDGNAVRELAGPALGKLPSVVPSDTVVGHLKPVPGAELGLRPGVPVVIGAGDRQCEVLGSGASEHHPMVSWGTTGNVSVPVQERPVPSPAGAVVTRAADGGWLLEGGLSAAGSFLAWLSRLLDRSTEELGRLAAESGPGRTRRGGGALARRCPCPVVARRRASWFHRSGRGARCGRHGESRGRVGRLGRAAGDGGGHGRPTRRIDRGGRDARRCRVGTPRLGRGPHVRARHACAASPLGRGGVGRSRTPRRQGVGHGSHPGPDRSRGSRH